MAAVEGPAGVFIAPSAILTAAVTGTPNFLDGFIPAIAPTGALDNLSYFSNPSSKSRSSDRSVMGTDDVNGADVEQSPA